MSEFKMSLPDDVRFIIDRMNSHGYAAHVVGGSVRDSFIGRELGDFDITTNALPEQTKAVFADYKTVDTGIKHGTVTLVVHGVPYEITTYRVDGDYKDNRHPDSVSFTASLEEDLKRRDFTVNAMAYDPCSGLIDLFGGCDDADNRLIRAVGDPYLRFDEDALRILRALRFASVLGFDIEDKTAEAARALSMHLESISKERIYTELKKLISGTAALKIIGEYRDVLSVALGGFEIEKLPAGERFDAADYLTRLASLIWMNSDDPVCEAECILGMLKTDKLTRTYITSVFKAYDSVSFASEHAALCALANYGKESVEGALRLGILTERFADSDAQALASAISSGVPYMISQLDVRGTDLFAIGISGEKIGQMLKSLLFAVIDGKVENQNSLLVDYARSLA